MYKQPGIAETIDWAAALVALGQRTLDEAVVAQTIGALLKYQEDVKKIRQHDLGTRVVEARKAALA